MGIFRQLKRTHKGGGHHHICLAMCDAWGCRRKSKCPALKGVYDKPYKGTYDLRRILKKEYED